MVRLTVRRRLSILSIGPCLAIEPWLVQCATAPWELGLWLHVPILATKRRKRPWQALVGSRNVVAEVEEQCQHVDSGAQREQ